MIRWGPWAIPFALGAFFIFAICSDQIGIFSDQIGNFDGTNPNRGAILVLESQFEIFVRHFLGGGPEVRGHGLVWVPEGFRWHCLQEI